MAAPAKLNEFWGKNKYGRQNTEADKPAVNILSRNVLHLLFPFCIQQINKYKYDASNQKQFFCYMKKRFFSQQVKYPIGRVKECKAKYK